MNARSVLNKITEIESLTIIYEPDLLALTETWPQGGINDADAFPRSYNAMRHDGTTRGGGVALLIKKPLK